LLALQQQAGNQSVLNLLRANGIYRKQSTGQADDPEERAADQVASRIMRSPAGHPSGACSCAAGGEQCEECREKGKRVQTRLADGAPAVPLIQRACACGGTCTACRNSGDEHKPGTVQMRASEGQRAVQRREPVVPGDSPWHPLDRTTRSFMEHRFRADLSDVRVHTDSRAARSAARLHADAYTTGRDIYFAAGKYEPSSRRGMHLLAHELTHVQQQRGPIAAHSNDPAIGSIHDPLEREAERTADTVVAGRREMPKISRTGRAALRRFPTLAELQEDAAQLQQGAEDLGNRAVAGLRSAATRLEQGVEAAGEWAGEKIGEAEQEVSEVASSAVNWLETEAGSIARSLANSFGVGVSVTSAGLVITVPRFCPVDAMIFPYKLPSFDAEKMVPAGALPLGPFVVTGEIGIAGHLQPEATVQIGPFCLEGIIILINPITNTYGIAGTVSASAAASLAGEARGGLRGQLGLEGVIPIGGVPVPVKVPLVGLEGGLAGKLRGIAAGKLSISEALTISHGTISLSQSAEVGLGAAADLFLGAYAQLELLGKSVCRIYWQPYSWHGDIAGRMTVGVGLSITPGGSPRLMATVSPPDFSRIPFSDLGAVLSRKGFSDDCPIKDRICEVVRDLHLLPSQNGGTWNWAGPYGPGKRLPGPLVVYQKNPGIPSGAQCRGACGPDCKTCKAEPVHRFTDAVTGDTWEYANYQDCNTNTGCREHDAGFDWAAAVHGEIGRGAIIMPWHMAANLECTCNYLAGNCIAWIAGLPPYDGKMYFADSAKPVSGGGTVPPGPSPTPGGGGTIGPHGGGGGVSPLGPRPKIYMDPGAYPESAKHAKEAIGRGRPVNVEIDRPGASARRRSSVGAYKKKYDCDGAGKGKAPCTTTGQQYDEYPQAMFQENGGNADVKPITGSDNMGSGASVGNQCRPYNDGTGVKIVIAPIP
jgi:hypothetical protein